MRGRDGTSGSLFSYVDLEERIPPRHPLRKIRQVVNDALASLDADFEALYIDFGRPSIPPERLIRASLLQILFSVRSERQLMEQMDYNLMFRWFVGLGIDDPVWVPTVFTKNRDRLLTTDMSRKVMAAILAHREVAPLLSDEHFSVDGTLIKAWASKKMGWLPPSPEGIAMCQSRAVESDKTERTANERYNDRGGSGKERFPTPWGFDDWSGQVPQEADTPTISSVHGRSRTSNCSHGSVWQCQLLGQGDVAVRP
jgi:transposase